ncbi:MAG: hypothetical protein RL110_472 [Bacteroidota bacterium]|jgi:hypothetical protein
MKKLLLSLVAVASFSAVNAQNLVVNGDFEQTATPLLPGVATDCPGWGPGFYTMDVMAPFAGTQSAKMRTVVDAALNAQLGLGSDTIPGLMVQEVAGSWANVANMTFSFSHKQLIPAGDTAIILCQFSDTMGAGMNDDVILFQAYGAYTGNLQTWASASVPMTAIPGAVGTANLMTVVATSSYNAIFAGLPAVPNAQFWIDNVSVGTSGANILEEVASVNVYPNPTNGILNFDATEEISVVSIYGMDGKLAFTTNSNSVDISALPIGMYHYIVTTVTGKVIQGKVSKI